MNLVIVVPCFNAQDNLSKLVSSIRSQKDDRWSCVMIDDISNDGTWKTMTSLVGDDSRFTLVKNKVKKYALRNIVETSRKYKKRDVAIGVVDGDDFLCNDDTVSLVLEEYEKGADVVWTAHRWDINGMNISREIPNGVNPYQWPWCSSHFRTFRSSLLDKIPDENFQDFKGRWFKRGYDQALLLPLLYKAKSRVYIPNVCYQYNIESVSLPVRDPAEREQISTVSFVRSRGFLEKDENSL